MIINSKHVLVNLFSMAILTLFAAPSFCQHKQDLNYGQISTDTGFSCVESHILIQGTSNEKNYFKSVIPPICSSNNELEIRVFIPHNPIPIWDMYILSYNKDSNWSAKCYKYDIAHKVKDTLDFYKIYDLKPIVSFDSIFILLKENNIFTIPKGTFPLDNDCEDGEPNPITIAFKAKCFYRIYSYDHTNCYMERYNEIKEFRNFDNIVHIFKNLFIKEFAK